MILVSNTHVALIVVAWLAGLLNLIAAQHITLAQEFQKHGIANLQLDDLDREITSYAVASDERWFAIAYYWHTGSDLLPPDLRVRTLDRRNNVWRSALLNADVRQGGSAVGIARRAGFIYLDLHISPSAGSLLVLSDNLKVRKRLYGWSSLILGDGRVLYENSMVHFAPAHPGSVSLYDPRSGLDTRVYPVTPDPETGGVMIDRSIGTIQLVGTTRVRFHVTEQNVVWGTDNRSVRVGTAREAIVTCDISKPTPACVAQPQEKGRQE